MDNDVRDRVMECNGDQNSDQQSILVSDRLARPCLVRTFLFIFSLSISLTSNLIIIRRSVSAVDELRSLR
jgi:hypothetical protein